MFVIGQRLSSAFSSICCKQPQYLNIKKGRHTVGEGDGRRILTVGHPASVCVCANLQCLNC